MHQMRPTARHGKRTRLVIHLLTHTHTHSLQKMSFYFVFFFLFSFCRYFTHTIPKLGKIACSLPMTNACIYCFWNCWFVVSTSDSHAHAHKFTFSQVFVARVRALCVFYWSLFRFLFCFLAANCVLFKFKMPFLLAVKFDDLFNLYFCMLATVIASHTE